MKNIFKLIIIYSSVLISLSNCSTVEKARTAFDQTRETLKENAQVYDQDAFYNLNKAKNFNQINRDLHNRSIAQVVFPKVIKGSFIFGGNYAEGYLIENGLVVSEIRMIGGNIGPHIGGQSYSQITYIMNTDALSEIKNGQKFSLQGTATYAKEGKSVTDIFGQISDGQSLVTIIFNQSGYLAGISFEGTYILEK